VRHALVYVLQNWLKTRSHGPCAIVLVLVLVLGLLLASIM
jgi:hypothetical protein